MKLGRIVIIEIDFYFNVNGEICKGCNVVLNYPSGVRNLSEATRYKRRDCIEVDGDYLGNFSIRKL